MWSMLRGEARSSRLGIRETPAPITRLPRRVLYSASKQRNLSNHVYSEIEIEGILSRLDTYRKARGISSGRKAI